MKPNLVDYSQFVKKKPTPQIIEKEIKIPVNNTNIIFYLFNIIILLIIIIGGYLLYLRYHKKNNNEYLYKKKIENLYNTINKY